MIEPPGLPDDWWTSTECADAIGVAYNTWTSYVSRGQAPEADRWFGRTPVWRPGTVRAWRDRYSRPNVPSSNGARSPERPSSRTPL